MVLTHDARLKELLLSEKTVGRKMVLMNMCVNEQKLIWTDHIEIKKTLSIISEGTLEVWTNQHLTLKNSFENITDQSVYGAP